MFTIKTNHIYTVSTASSFTRKDGKKGAVIILREKDNQPENAERPSKSMNPVKIWLDELPENVKNGCTIKLNGFSGFDWKHIPSNYYKEAYEEVIELLDAEFEVVA